MDTIYPILTIYHSEEPGVEPADLETELHTTQESIFLQWGFLTPLPRLEVDSNLPPRTFQMGIGERRLEPFTRLEDGELWISATMEVLQENFFDAMRVDNPEMADMVMDGTSLRASTNPLTGEPAAILHPGAYFNTLDPAKLFIEAELIVLDPVSFFMGTIGGLFIQLLPELMTQDVVEAYLGALGNSHPNLVEAAMQIVGLEQITASLLDRLSAGGSILDLPTILQEMLEVQVTA